MVGICRVTGKPIGRRAHIAQAIETLLITGQGEMVMARDMGVDYLDAGRPLPGLAPARVEASAQNALTRDEPRIELDAVTAHFDGDELTSVRVAYRDREDASQHAVVVDYRNIGPHPAEELI